MGVLRSEKVKVTDADLTPVDAATFIVTGTSKLPNAGMILPAASNVVQVQLGVTVSIVMGALEILERRNVRVMVDRGSMNPKLINGGSARTVVG